jgi:hypothetical protein
MKNLCTIPLAGNITALNEVFTSHGSIVFKEKLKIKRGG